MSKFTELSRSEIKQMKEDLLIKRLPKSALLSNVVQLDLTTNMNDVVPTKFYAYNGNINGENAFVLAKQDKQKYNPAVTWTICAPEAKYVTADMFNDLELIVDWTMSNSFSSIRAESRDGLTELCRKHGVLQSWGPDSVFWRRRDEEIVEDSSSKTAENITVVDLDTEEDARKLTKYWKYASESTIHEVSDAVKFIPSAGVKVNDELVAWGYTSTDGAIHALYTLENHRGRGYSKLVLNSLWEMLTKKGLHAITQVEDLNLLSGKLMLSAGFQFAYTMTWMEYSPNMAAVIWTK